MRAKGRQGPDGERLVARARGFDCRSSRDVTDARTNSITLCELYPTAQSNSNEIELKLFGDRN